MIISNIINDSLGLLSKQLRFYCWHFRRSLDHRQRQELVELLYEQKFDNLANKIKILNQSAIQDCRQQIGKLLFEHCFSRNRRQQLIQLIESNLVDINVRLDNYGRTLLHRSAYNLDVKLVKLLIQCGVDIRLRDYAGNTALHIAIQSYRNGAISHGNGNEVVQSLTSIITLLLEADNSLRTERLNRKRIKLTTSGNHHLSKSPRYHQTDHSRSPTTTTNNHQHDHHSIVDCNNNVITNQKHAPSTLSISNNNNDRIDCNSSSQNQQSNQHHQMSTATDSTAKDLKSTNQLTISMEPQEFSQESPTTTNNNNTNNNPSTTKIQSPGPINPILSEDFSKTLVDTKNAFGRTALHYCVLVVGEQYLAHFVQLLISFGADTDSIDARMKTPLYCLVKRPGISMIKEKCTAISHLLKSGCDDLGLAITSESILNQELINKFEASQTNNPSRSSSTIIETSVEPIFNNTTFRRLPSLKHLSRLKLIKLNNEVTKLNRQVHIALPSIAPKSLNIYMNRKLLDQTEMFI